MWRGSPLPATRGQPILQRIGPSNKETAVEVKYRVFVKKAELCKYSTPLFTCMRIAINVYNVRNTHATWKCGLRACVPLVCLCASCVPCACALCQGLAHWFMMSCTPVQDCSECTANTTIYIYICPPIGSRLIFRWLMLLCGWPCRKYCWAKWHDSC